MNYVYIQAIGFFSSEFVLTQFLIELPVWLSTYKHMFFTVFMPSDNVKFCILMVFIAFWNVK